MASADDKRLVEGDTEEGDERRNRDPVVGVDGGPVHLEVEAVDDVGEVVLDTMAEGNHEIEQGPDVLEVHGAAALDVDAAAAGDAFFASTAVTFSVHYAASPSEP